MIGESARLSMAASDRCRLPSLPSRCRQAGVLGTVSFNWRFMLIGPCAGLARAEVSIVRNACGLMTLRCAPTYAEPTGP